MKKDKEEIKDSGTVIDSEVGTEIDSELGTEIDSELGTDNALFNFELPDVSEKTDDFIQSDIDAPENENVNVPEFVENAEAEKHRGTLDDKGQPYDPQLHACPPEKTGKFGKWKKLPKNKQQQKAVEDVQHNAEFRANAQKFALLYGESHKMLFGIEGGKVNKEEINPLIDAIERYLMENGNVEISAGIDVLISSGFYSYMVCQRETNIDKVKNYFGKIINSTKSLFGIKEKKKEIVPESEKQNA